MTGSVVESKRASKIGTWVHLELRIKIAASILDVDYGQKHLPDGGNIFSGDDNRSCLLNIIYNPRKCAIRN